MYTTHRGHIGLSKLLFFSEIPTLPALEAPVLAILQTRNQLLLFLTIKSELVNPDLGHDVLNTFPTAHQPL